MTGSFFSNWLCENSSLALTCPQGEEESIPLQWVESGRYNRSAFGQKRTLIKAFMQPDFWVKFISTNGLTEATAEVPRSHDQSGLGAELQFLSEKQSIDEATNFWPGLAVAIDGYVPIGSCLSGSGDYYYIRAADGAAGPLYRIYHDVFTENGYDPEEAIAVVLSNYEALLDHVQRK